MPGYITVELKGLQELQAKCRDNALYEVPGKQALRQIAKYAEAVVIRAAPMSSGRLMKRVFSKVNDRVRGPRWAVVGTKATFTPRKPGARGGQTRYPYAYPRRLEFDPASRHYNWLQNAINQAQPAFSKALSQAARDIESAWGHR